MLDYLRWVRTPLRRRLGFRLVIDSDPDPARSVFLAGTARSGTTWLSEVINARNEFRYIFEPFHPDRVPVMAPFGARPYLRPDEDRPDLLPLAEHVISGRIRSGWTERFNRRVIAQRRLVKDVRANLMLGWLKRHFPAMPVVIVIRHPCAVANSYAKQGWPGSVGALLEQPALVEDVLAPHLELVHSARDAFERAVIIWCVETLVPLRQLAPDGVHVAFYEDLVMRPDAELERLFEFLGMPYDGSVLQATRRPSRTSRRDSAIAVGRDPVTNWLERVDPDRRRRARDIVARFGLDGLYRDGPLPDVTALAEFPLFRSEGVEA